MTDDIKIRAMTAFRKQLKGWADEPATLEWEEMAHLLVACWRDAHAESPESVSNPDSWDVSSGVHKATLRPVVMISWGPMVVVLPPADVGAKALGLLQAMEAAITDAGIAAYCAEAIEGDNQQEVRESLMHFLHEYRARRMVPDSDEPADERVADQEVGGDEG